MRLHKTCQGFALFIAWFNGICATVCGLWMALSAVAELPLSWNVLMPVSILNPLPIPTFMKEGFLWAGVALVIVNGVPNICAVVERLRKKEKSFCFWGLVAGCALVLWTTFDGLHTQRHLGRLSGSRYRPAVLEPIAQERCCQRCRLSKTELYLQVRATAPVWRSGGFLKHTCVFLFACI